MSTGCSLQDWNSPKNQIWNKKVFFDNLDLSDVASSVKDRLDVRLADVVVVARRGSHLDKDLTKDFLLVSSDLQNVIVLPRCSPVPFPWEGIS